MSVNNTITPQFQVLSIETTVAGTPFEGYDYVKKCATEYSAISKEKDLPNIVNLLIFQLEEEEILALKNTESASYKTLKATMEPIMERLQCNIVVVIGHTETCFTYIDKTGIPTLNSLPTIILVVACFSSSQIARYNTDPKMIEKKYFFFGFQNLMHLLHGEILACKSPHLATPFLDCRYEEVKEDIEVIRANVKQYNKPYEQQIDLLKCCKGRYEHFKQVFYDYLSKRECVKFPTEQLFAKLKGIRKEDGSLFRYGISQNNFFVMTEEDKKKYIFSRSEGIPCTDEGNCSTGKTMYTTYKANLAKFDDRVKFGNDATKKIFAILNETSRYTPEQLALKDKEMLDILKALPKKTALSVLLHPAVYRNESTDKSYTIVLYFFVFAENYKLTSQEILKNHDVPLDIVVKNEYTLVNFILEHLMRTYPKPTLSEAEAYRLIKAIGQKNVKSIEVAFQSNKGISMLFENKKCYLSLIELIFRYFPTAAPNSIFQYILILSEYVSNGNWTLEQAIKVLELFASFEKFTEAKGAGKISILTSYESKLTSSTSASYKLLLEFIIFIYIYLQDTNKYPDTLLDKKIKQWEEKLTTTKDYMKPKVNRVLKVYQTAKAFFDAKGIPIQDYRKIPEEMNKLLDKDLEDIESKTSAIENVKTYFATVQPNIQKRKDLNTATKTAAIQQLVGLYKGINSTKNEGENALRRLREMHEVYKKFLTNHPREDKKLPEVRALTDAPSLDSFWLYEIVASYIRSLQTPKPKAKTAKKPKFAKISNVATLQRELNEISGRLNTHNRGGIRLHHMTAKSLRRQRDELIQRIRNLTPALPPVANQNENKEGGRRKTRKNR